MNAVTEKFVKDATVVITPPRFATVELVLAGTAPLVIERFSKKSELMLKMQEGKSAGSKKVRTARDYDKETEDARYRSEEGWEGMNAAAFRAGMRRCAVGRGLVRSGESRQVRRGAAGLGLVRYGR